MTLPALRTRLNRNVGRAITATLERHSALDLFVNTRADTRRLHTKIAQARRQGMRIDTVFDIGAHRGDWTRMARASLPDAEFILFEANEVHASALEGERFYIGVLSSEQKLVQFHAKGGPGDSYFRETTGLYDGVPPISVKATTLDEMVHEHGIPPPDFIKADVQGAELDVLRGGDLALAKASLVLLECPIVEYNEGAPTMHEYFRFMDERGFTPIDVIEWHRRDGRAHQLDVLFGEIAVSR